VVGDLLDRLAGEHLGVLAGLLDRLGVVRPPRCQGRVAVVFEQFGLPVPTAGQQPQPMHEHHRLESGGIRALALLELVLVIVLSLGETLDSAEVMAGSFQAGSRAP